VREPYDPSRRPKRAHSHELVAHLARARGEKADEARRVHRTGCGAGWHGGFGCAGACRGHPWEREQSGTWTGEETMRRASRGRQGRGRGDESVRRRCSAGVWRHQSSPRSESARRSVVRRARSCCRCCTCHAQRRADLAAALHRHAPAAAGCNRCCALMPCPDIASGSGEELSAQRRRGSSTEAEGPGCASGRQSNAARQPLTPARRPSTAAPPTQARSIPPATWQAQTSTRELSFLV